MKKIIYSLSLVTVLGLAACSNEKDIENEASTPTEEQAAEKINAETEQTVERLNFKSDEEIKNDILKEQGVTSANVVSMDGADGKKYVLVDIMIQTGSKSDIKALADRYGKLLKEKNADSIVDVKIIDGTETVEQVTVE